MVLWSMRRNFAANEAVGGNDSQSGGNEDMPSGGNEDMLSAMQIYSNPIPFLPVVTRDGRQKEFRTHDVFVSFFSVRAHARGVRSAFVFPTNDPQLLKHPDQPKFHVSTLKIFAAKLLILPSQPDNCPP